jgi:hypothetical protein
MGNAFFVLWTGSAMTKTIRVGGLYGLVVHPVAVLEKGLYN